MTSIDRYCKTGENERDRILQSTGVPPVRIAENRDGFMYFIHGVDFGNPRDGDTIESRAFRVLPGYIEQKFQKFKDGPSAECHFYWASLIYDLPVKKLNEYVSDGTLNDRLPKAAVVNGRSTLLNSFTASGYIIKPDSEAELEKRDGGGKQFTREIVTRKIIDYCDSVRRSKTSFVFRGSEDTEVAGIFYNPTRVKMDWYEHEAKRKAEILQEITKERVGVKLPIKVIKQFEVPLGGQYAS